MKAKRWCTIWIAAVVAQLAIGAAVASAGTGTLDPSFGKNGRVLTPATISSGAALHTGVTMARSENGRVVLAGGQTLVRYLPNGTVDHSFGHNGRRSIHVAGAKKLTIEDVAVDSNGKVMAVGSLWGDNTTKAFIARYLPTGAPDASFGDQGIVQTDFGFPGGTYTRSNGEVFTYQSAVTANGITIDTEGRIIITGTERAGAGECPKAGVEAYDFGYVARLGNRGGLDPTFGVGGLVVDSTVAWAGQLASESSGTLFYVGDRRGNCYVDYSGAYTSLVGLGNDGKPSTTFGTGGRVRLLPSESKILDLAVDHQGRIWTLALPSSLEAEFRWFNQAIVSRLSPNGSIDTSFGNSGQVKVWLPGEESGLRSIAVDSKGRALLAGQVSTSKTAGRKKPRKVPYRRFAIVRLNASGRLDRGFGHGGRVFTAFGARTSADGTDLMVVGANQVLVGGPARGPLMRGGQGFALARYLNGR